MGLPMCSITALPNTVRPQGNLIWENNCFTFTPCLFTEIMVMQFFSSHSCGATEEDHEYGITKFRMDCYIPESEAGI